jgi:hypothetical protein
MPLSCRRHCGPHSRHRRPRLGRKDWLETRADQGGAASHREPLNSSAASGRTASTQAACAPTRTAEHDSTMTREHRPGRSLRAEPTAVVHHRARCSPSRVAARHRADLNQSVGRRADDEDQRCQSEPPAYPKQRQSAVIGDPIVATALLDRLLHHAVVIQIEGSSYRLRQHADLMPEHLRSKAVITPPLPTEPPRRRGRPPKMHALDQPAG